MFVGELIQQTDYNLKYTLKSHIIRTLKFILRALSTIQRSFRDEKLLVNFIWQGRTNKSIPSSDLTVVLFCSS